MKTKADLKEGHDITYHSHPWIVFSFNQLFIIWRGGVRLKLDVLGQLGRRI